MSDWKETVGRVVMEARKVLTEDYGLPDTHDALILALQTYEPVDVCSDEARRVVTGYKRLNENIDRNKMHRALDAITDIYGHYEQMWHYTKIENEPRKKGMKPIRETYFIEGAPDYSVGDLLRKGMNQMASKKRSGRTPEIPINKYQNTANQLYSPGDKKPHVVDKVYAKMFEERIGAEPDKETQAHFKWKQNKEELYKQLNRYIKVKIYKRASSMEKQAEK